MKTTLPFALSILLVVLLPLGESWEAPSFCHGYECPVFSVINTNENFEERLYSSTRWITTNIASASEQDVGAGLWKLYQYTQSQNNEGRTLPTTRPGLVSVIKTGGNEQVSVSLYVGPDTVLPKASDESIKETTRPGGTIYVKVFSGLPSETLAQDNKQKLMEALRTAGVLFDESRYDAAGYDSMLTLVNRHNEVWIHAV